MIGVLKEVGSGAGGCLCCITRGVGVRLKGTVKHEGDSEAPQRRPMSIVEGNVVVGREGVGLI